MSNQPMVSIVTVCYNAEKSIEHALKSVLSQTYQDFEYIVKDGASTDQTMQIIENYRDKFAAKGIRFVVVSEKDSGIYDAMNRAVQLCSGTWINFMNADDRFYDEHVLEQIFGQNQYETSHILYGDTLEMEYGEYYFYCKNLNLIEERMPFSHQSTFARREVLLQYPFDLNYKIAADYDFLLTTYQAGLTFTDVNTIVSVVEKEGVSSLSLYDSFVQAVELHKNHGIVNFTEKQYKRKLLYARIKQFGMDFFPNWLKYLIRRYQRLIRKQKRVM